MSQPRGESPTQSRRKQYDMAHMGSLQVYQQQLQQRVSMQFSSRFIKLPLATIWAFLALMAFNVYIVCVPWFNVLKAVQVQTRNIVCFSVFMQVFLHLFLYFRSLSRFFAWFRQGSMSLCSSSAWNNICYKNACVRLRDNLILFWMSIQNDK